MTASKTEQNKKLEIYKKSIASLAKKKDSMIFLNTGKEHASIVMGNIFRSSKDQVRIFAGDLNGDVSNNEFYQTNLFDFLGRGGKVKILLENYDEKEKTPQIFESLRSIDFFYPENVEVKLSDTQLVTETDDTKSIVHFTVGDCSMYRFEYDTKKYLAKGSFNDPEKSKYLVEIFDEIFTSSSKHIF